MNACKLSSPLVANLRRPLILWTLPWRVRMPPLSPWQRQYFNRLWLFADGAGAFFLGARFSLFDIALAPFWQRFLWVGPHYRPFFKLPAAEDDEDFARLHAWWRATRNHPAVKATLVCKPRLVASYADYTVNKGTSDFAQGMQASLKPRASTDDSGTGAGQGAGAGSHK